ncbi:MAG TPA: hypothetical protein VIO61_03415 [Anaerolineaceae bacterium]
MNKKFILLIAFLIALLAVLVLRRAWMSDDAYITLRVIDNFRNGYGLTWNIAERVQVYTHPLWMMLEVLVISITNDYYLIPIFLGFGFTLLAVTWIFAKLAQSSQAAVLAGLALCLSNAFVDYATSGLENPLSHVLIGVFFTIFLTAPSFHRHIGRLSLVAALGMLTRIDLGLVFLPALLIAFFQVRSWKALIRLLAGMIPLLIWEGFSLVYYGSLLPNTAYAKLYGGYPTIEYLQRGLNYYEYSLKFDPVTILIIFTGLILPLFIRGGRIKMLSASSLAYLGYILWIGGDFMGGRFFTIPFYLGIIALLQIKQEFLKFRYTAVGVSLLMIMGLILTPEPVYTLGSLSMSGRKSEFYKGIADERQFYFPGTSLMNYRRDIPYPSYPWMDEGRKDRRGSRTVIVNATGGMRCFAGGPRIHYVDHLGITDPFLARLPAVKKDNWRVGHLERAIPAGYLESISTGRNLLQDPHLAQSYDRIKLITQGDLFDPERMKVIVQQTFGLTP